MALAAVPYAGMAQANARLPLAAALAVNTALIAVFVAYTIWRDFPLGALPVVGRRLARGKGTDNDNTQDNK